MKVYKSRLKNTALLLYKLSRPVFDPIYTVTGIINYFKYFLDMFKYLKQANGSSKITFIDLYPTLHDAVSETPFDSHYFYQQFWLFEQILKNRPKLHYDFGSSYQMSGYISKITKTVFCDIRPTNIRLPNLSIRKEDLVSLSFKDNSLKSISCLHVIEHIGLGRYGDTVDPLGAEKAAKELVRVLKKGGTLYISCPIGIDRVCFNAHRVFPPQKVVDMFKDLEFMGFSVVNDDRKYIQNDNLKKYSKASYACGMFIFRKI